jgi:MscS family membrane protein
VITTDITQMLRAHEEIDQEQTMIVNFNAFSSSSVDIMVYTFTKTIVWTEFHQVKQDVLLKIYEIVDTHGAEIAFPTQTLHIDTQDTPIQFSGLSVSEPVVK